MSIVFIIIGILSILYFMNFIIFGGGAGFQYFWLLLSLFCFIIAYFIKHNVLKTHIPKTLRGILLIAVLLVIILFFAVEALIIKDSIKLEEYESTDYLIILGAAVKGEQLSLTLYHRMNEAIEYLEEHPKTQVIASGGQGPGEDITEAEAMRRYLIRNGIEEDRIILEEKSTSTEENLRYSLEIIKDFNENASISVVSSDFHIFRAKFLASNLGSKVQGIPSKTFRPLLLNYYVREFFAVVKDFFVNIR